MAEQEQHSDLVSEGLGRGVPGGLEGVGQAQDREGRSGLGLVRFDIVLTLFQKQIRVIVGVQASEDQVDRGAGG